jgi:four helix bundle protein
MAYKRFEDLPVWQKAMELAQEVHDLTETAPFKKSHSLRDQLERAALSVSNNIAEGFERGTTKEQDT